MALLWSIFTILFFAFPFISAGEDDKAPKTFIVHVDNDLKPSEFSDVGQWYLSMVIRSINIDPLKSNVISHVYKTVFHGFSAELTPQQAQELQLHPEILGLFPSRVIPIQTTHSPEFLGLSSTTVPDRLSQESDYGSNIIIGMLDSGIWPEHRSFNDEGLDPNVPPHWKGVCEGGDGFPKCNKKIIGVRSLVSGSKHYNKTARDHVGHGTHTSSTAAGRAVNNASYFGYAKGEAVGMAPKARLAIYKVCEGFSCLEADILAGFDKAVEDGVNVISISIGFETPIPLIEDTIAIGSFGAMDKGITVSAAGGNSGPNLQSVTNGAPWMITVGAGTIDRRFTAHLSLENGSLIKGVSLYTSKPLSDKDYVPLIYAGNASESGYGADCYGPLDKGKVHGKLVVCDDDGIVSPLLMAATVKSAGGVGVVVASLYRGDLSSFPFWIPGLCINETTRQLLLDYIFSTQNPRCKVVLGLTELGVKPAPLAAIFSSRGPNSISTYIMKPDVIAPGVKILAAWPADLPPIGKSPFYDPPPIEFNILSGTSMACPHVSGIAALLKGAHQDWSPAMVQSALMTTARSRDRDGNPILDQNYNRTTVWAIGSGLVDPERALDPGLVYDSTPDDYVDFLCSSGYRGRKLRIITRRTVKKCNQTKPWDLNYPAISVVFNTSKPALREIEAQRTVTHVKNETASYNVIVENPKGVSVAVDPQTLVFQGKGEKLSYKVMFTTEALSNKFSNNESKSEFGKLTWSDGKHQVTSPLVVTWCR